LQARYNGDTMSNGILARIIRESGVPGLMEALTEGLPLADLQSLLLEVYLRRTKVLSPHNVLGQYKKNRFVQPAHTDPRRVLALDRLAYSLLPPGYETVELSPVCPLGTVSVLSPIDQNNALTTIRNTEVCADSTNIMALECAVRRQQLLAVNPRTADRIRLCASHRLLRYPGFHGGGRRRS